MADWQPQIISIAHYGIFTVQLSEETLNAAGLCFYVRQQSDPLNQSIRELHKIVCNDVDYSDKVPGQGIFQGRCERLLSEEVSQPVFLHWRLGQQSRN